MRIDAVVVNLEISVLQEPRPDHAEKGNRNAKRGARVPLCISFVCGLYRPMPG
jgi:hypothetical protein